MSSRLIVIWKTCLETHITAPSSRGARKDPEQNGELTPNGTIWHPNWKVQVYKQQTVLNGTGILKVHQCGSMSYIIHVRYVYYINI